MLKKHYTAEYFDKDYFLPGTGKNTFQFPFEWQNNGYECMQMAKNIKEILHPQRILDVGCAFGFQVKACCYLGIDAYGCDISRWAVEHCVEGAKGRLEACDVRDGLPYADGRFDGITCSQTLEHIEDYYLDHVVEEMRRVIKDWLAIDVPFGDYAFGDPTHMTYKPITGWLALFQRHALTFDTQVSFGRAMIFRK